MQDKTQPIAIEQLVKRLNGFIYVSTDLRIFLSRGGTLFFLQGFFLTHFI